MLKRLLIGAACWLGLIAPTFAQTVVQNQISGNEVWSAAQGPGGPSQWLPLTIARGGTAITTATVTGNVTLPSALQAGGNYVVTAQPSAATITMPSNPVVNGAIIGICNPTASAWTAATVTVAGNTGQTSPVGATATLTTLGAGTCARYQYNLANTTWYRVQ